MKTRRKCDKMLIFGESKIMNRSILFIFFYIFYNTYVLLFSVGKTVYGNTDKI